MEARKLLTPFFIAFLALTLSIRVVYAPEGIDVSELPQQVADAMNLPLLAGQLLTSSVILAFFLFPTMLLTSKYSSQSTAVLIVSFMVLGTLIAVGWLPYWFLLIISLLIAYMYAGRFRDFLSGK